MIAAGAAGREKRTGEFGVGLSSCRWDQQFESGSLQRRVRKLSVPGADGLRRPDCFWALVFRDADELFIQSRDEKPLGRHYPSPATVRAERQSKDHARISPAPKHRVAASTHRARAPKYGRLGVSTGTCTKSCLVAGENRSI
jgi:hypothetical protein